MKRRATELYTLSGNSTNGETRREAVILAIDDIQNQKMKTAVAFF